MRRQVRGFFYALTVLVGGVLGSRKACRILDPVDQPDTSSTALSLVAPVGGYKTAIQEQSMKTPITGEIRPATPTINLSQDADYTLCPSVFTTREAGIIKKALVIIENKRLRDAPVLHYFHDLERYLILRFAGFTNEQAQVLYLDINHRLLSAETEFYGHQSQVLWDIRKVVLRAISLGAAHLVFAHNHPAGNPTPSDQDVQHLTWAQDALKSLSISVLDSFVVTADRITSIKDYRAVWETAQKNRWQAEREQCAAERKAKLAAKRTAKQQAQLQGA